MENLFEILVPLIFAAVYFIGNFLSNKGTKPGRGRGRETPADPGAGREPSDFEEQQRRIREEIRRKIAQRRGEDPDQARPGTEPTIFAETRAPAAPREEPEELEPWNMPDEPPEPAFSVEPGFESEMQERLRQIEETRRKAEALRKKAKRTATARPAPGTSPVRAGRMPGIPVGPVRAQLLDVSNARAAFIYAEVFGAPAAVREPAPQLPAQRRMAG